MYGDKFKSLRVSQKISLQTAAQGITSISSLSKWENGLGKMDFDKVMQLLKRIDCLPNELVVSEKSDVTKHAQQLYENDKFCELIKLAKQELNNFKNKRTYDNLYNAVLTAGAVKSACGINVFSANDQRALAIYLSDIDEWTHDKISLFACGLFMLPASKIYRICGLAIDFLIDHQHQDPLILNDSLLSLLNAVFALIQNKEAGLGEQLLQKFNLIQVDDQFALFLLKKRFLQLICEFINSGDGSKLEMFISFLNKIPMKKFAAECQDTYEHCKSNYSTSI